MCNLHLALLETSGNQSYIFGTNKLRDIIGSSELVYRVGTKFLEDAIKETFGSKHKFSVSELLKQKSVADKDSPGFEVMVATSGKAIVLVKDKEKAQKLVTNWSRIVLKKAPGVDATGVVSSLFDFNKSLEDGIGAALKEVHEIFEATRSSRTSHLNRFRKIPVVASCVYSGYPAEDLRNVSEGTQVPLSKTSHKKWLARKSQLCDERFTDLFGTEHYFEGLKNPGQLEEQIKKSDEAGWIGVIHADGNGLGQLFMKFHRYIDLICKDDDLTEFEKTKKYVEYYRAFSCELDTVTQSAFRKALANTKNIFGRQKFWILPVVPIVVGGDDLTVMIDGRKAILFTKEFLENFNMEIQKNNSSESRKKLCELLESARDVLGAPYIGMCAGISITKLHFPFSTSYSLACDLIKNAKLVKQKWNFASSAMDFHILYDSTASKLELIRNKLLRSETLGNKQNEKKNAVTLTTKPFVMLKREGKPLGDPGNKIKPDKEWCEQHNWSKFEKALFALQAEFEDKRLLPSTHSHKIREKLFTEPLKVLESEWRILMEEYPKFRDKWHEDALFFTLPPTREDSACTSTLILDAIESDKFYNTANI